MIQIVKKTRSKKQLANDKRLGLMAKKTKGRTRASQSFDRRVKKANSKFIRGAKVAKKKTRRSPKKAKSSFLGNVMKKVGSPLAAVGYGFVRERLSDAVANSAIGKKIPGGQFTDEVTMIGMSILASKVGLGKNPIGNRVLKAAKIYEFARIGEGLADMKSTSGNSGNSGLF